MTQLKPSEKRLLTAFGVAGFLLLNLLGFSWLKKRNVVLERQRITLESRARELEMWKGKAAEADLKRAFLDFRIRRHFFKKKMSEISKVFLEIFLCSNSVLNVRSDLQCLTSVLL